MAVTKRQVLFVVLGIALVSAPFARAEEDYDEEYYDDDEDYAEEGEGGEASEADVVVLTDANFDATIDKHKYVLAEFYAPWCGHCKALAPEYAKAATALKSYDEDVILAKIDATQEKALAERFEVQGFPTLKWFVDGEAMEYGGGRDEKTIISWIKKKTGPPAVTVDSTEALAKFADDNVVLLGYFSKFEGDSYDAFTALAQKTDDVSFLETISKEVAAAYSLKTFGVSLKKNYDFEEGDAEFIPSTGELGSDALENFLTANKMPLFIPFSQSNAELIFESGIENQLMFIGDGEALSGDAFEPFKKVAAEYAGQLVFVTVNSDMKDGEPVLNFFGIKPDSDFPVIYGFSAADSKKYKHLGANDVASMSAFAKTLVDGTATPEYKSADPPASNDGDVTIVVGKTFDEIVKDEKKDVLLEIYAPWCGHCKQLEPIYKKLGKRFKKIDSVVIAKMDGTENEHPDVEIEGFPTILFFPAGGKESISMEDERTLAGMTKFIKKHATIEYTLPKKKASDDQEAEHDEL